MKKLLFALAGSIGLLVVFFKVKKALAAPLDSLMTSQDGFSPRLPDLSVGPVIESGLASYYGPNFNGKQTANGEIFNQDDMTAAHRTAKFGTRFLVTDTDTGNSVIVRINDRGPYADTAHRIIDLSLGAAKQLNIISKGVANVTLRQVA